MIQPPLENIKASQTTILMVRRGYMQEVGGNGKFFGRKKDVQEIELAGCYFGFMKRRAFMLMSFRTSAFRSATIHRRH